MRIAPLLDGIRALSGEKIQWYLASELRDRIRQTGVRISVSIDKLARKQYAVEPRQYEGRLLHQLPALRTPLGDIYVELYLNEPAETNRVALYRHGTRVIDDLARLDRLRARALDPALSCRATSTRRSSISRPARAAASSTMPPMRRCAKRCEPLEAKLVEIIEEQRRAEEEQASREQLRTIQRAFREALLALPAEEYDWFDIHARALPPGGGGGRRRGRERVEGRRRRRAFRAWRSPSPARSASASSSSSPGHCSAWRSRPPRASCGSAIGRSCGRCRAIARAAASSRSSQFEWRIVEGAGRARRPRDQAVTYLAPEEPGLARVEVTVRQRDVVCNGEGLVTVTHELLTAARRDHGLDRRGCPATPSSARRASPGARASTASAT